MEKEHHMASSTPHQESSLSTRLVFFECGVIESPFVNKRTTDTPRSASGAQSIFVVHTAFPTVSTTSRYCTGVLVNEQYVSDADWLPYSTVAVRAIFSVVLQYVLLCY